MHNEFQQTSTLSPLITLVTTFSSIEDHNCSYPLVHSKSVPSQSFPFDPFLLDSFYHRFDDSSGICLYHKLFFVLSTSVTASSTTILNLIVLNLVFASDIFLPLFVNNPSPLTGTCSYLYAPCGLHFCSVLQSQKQKTIVFCYYLFIPIA